MHSKKTELKQELSGDYDTLLMVLVGIRVRECKGVRGGMSQTIHPHFKANDSYMKDYNANNESSYLMYWDRNNLYRQAMLQKFSENNFKWRKETFTFDEDFIRNYDGDSILDICVRHRTICYSEGVSETFVKFVL